MAVATSVSYCDFDRGQAILTCDNYNLEVTLSKLKSMEEDESIVQTDSQITLDLIFRESDQT
jgi:hypothetical protein